MTETSTIPFPDRISVAPKADIRAAAVVLPAVAAAPFSLPTLQEVASAPAPALGLSANELLDRPSVAALCERLPKCDDKQTAEDEAEAGRGDSEVPFGRIDSVAHDTPINSAPRVDADELIKDFGIRPALSACHFGIPSDPNSVVETNASARQPSLGVSSRDLPAASSGVAGLSFEDEVSALELRKFAAVGARVSIKNVTTFAVAAASESISNSVSTESIPTT